MPVRVYHPKLDGLRALAILAVIFEHFVKNESIGGLGTSLFFCLSGYLITDIILGYRERMSVKQAALQFYWHRFIRLAPPFYLALTCCLLLGIGGTGRTLLADAFYLANFNVFANGSFNESSHFWTLSVEEQFYLIWFPIAIAAPFSRIPAIIFALIASSILFQIYTKFNHIPMSGVLPISSADVLCSGALLAYVFRAGGRYIEVMTDVLRPLFIFPAAALVVLDHLHLLAWLGAAKIVIMPVLVSLCMTALVRYSLSNAECRSLNWLSTPILRHIGKISYGLYVYHYFVPQIVDKFIPDIHDLILNRYYVGIILIISVLMAELSWIIVEKPMLKLKKIRFGQSVVLQPS
jgi:peptidoglycan/LPS O-acetylase OafA/YrhL